MAVGQAPIVIKKVKKVSGGGHHGGAWKVAYADFVTAMMAFFLLMWLINTTSPEQKRGIADYFAPASVSSTSSGSGGILGGTSLGKDGAKSDGSRTIVEQTAQEAPPETKMAGQSKSNPGATNADVTETEAMPDQQQARSQAALLSAAQTLRQALQNMPELAELSKQVLIDVTPEGLRIQLVDQDGRSMFNQGGTAPNDRARVLLKAVARVILQLPNRITISGHTSVNADGMKSEGDWHLSSARADVARQILQSAGVDTDRIYQVSGKSTSEPLYPDDPTLPGNRRIAIVLLKEAPVLPPNQSF